jgi:hypothetical protein
MSTEAQDVIHRHAFEGEIMRSFWLPAICRSAFWITVVTSSVFQSHARPASSSLGSVLQPWSSDVTLHRLPKALHGILTISSNGVDFRPDKDPPSHWPFEDIRTVDLANPRRLSLVTYQNSPWHLPGDRPFEFTLKTQMPPELAAELVRRVGKPAINGDPFREAASFATIPARHRTRMGGSNGVLRFTDSGIDYVSNLGDARSWRWADLETLAHPELYRLRVGAYLETFDFELKQPLTGNLFDRLWDHVYAQKLNIREQKGATDE